MFSTRGDYIMKAIGVNQFGNISDLTELDVPKPEPSSGRLIVQTKAFALNPYDLGIIDGTQAKYRPISLPAIPGSDVAGIIVDKDPSITEFNLGDSIVGLANLKGYSEYVSVPYRRATKLPAEISYRTAAGLPNAGITAYDIVFGALKDVSFSKVLIIGASGAVGTNLYQILSSLNKQVSVVINSKYTEQFDTADFNQVVFYDAPKTIEQLGLYDVIINVAPQNELADLYLAHLAPSGLLISTTGIDNFKTDPSRLVDFYNTDYKMNQAALEYLVKKVASQEITVPIAEILNFDVAEIQKAFHALQTQHPRGKYIVEV